MDRMWIGRKQTINYYFRDVTHTKDRRHYAGSGSEVTAKRFQLSKKMTPQTIAHCCGPVRHCDNQSRIPKLPLMSPDTSVVVVRSQLETGDSSLKTICPQSAQFHRDRVQKHNTV
ncbi:hypothetical protein TNCV_1474391 [Trichonephila clavipes]|nr:hypothetical protein TNCV_1474391 [Trichonephila clavipes]